MTYHATVLAPHPDHGMTGASRNSVPNTSADTEAGARSLAAVLGREPTHAELCAEVRRILSEPRSCSA